MFWRRNVSCVTKRSRTLGLSETVSIGCDLEVDAMRAVDLLRDADAKRDVEIHVVNAAQVNAQGTVTTVPERINDRHCFDVSVADVYPLVSAEAARRRLPLFRTAGEGPARRSPSSATSG